MLAIFTKGWVHGYSRDGRAVAGYYRKASPGTEQRAYDFYAAKPGPVWALGGKPRAYWTHEGQKA